MNSKFDFYEIVKLLSDDPKHAGLTGKLVVIRGKVQHEKTGEWIYGVSLYEKRGYGIIRRVYEKYLVATGKKADPSEFETGQTIKVSVDPKTDEGSAAE